MNTAIMLRSLHWTHRKSLRWISAALKMDHHKLSAACARLGVRTRSRMEATSGSNHHLWSEKPSYNAGHLRVRKERGTPRLCDCCGSSKEKAYHWANISRDWGSTEDYIRLCAKCHYRFDGIYPRVAKSLRSRAPTTCPQGHSFTKENTYYSRGRNGEPSAHRRCRACKRDSLRRYRARRKLGLVGGGGPVGHSSLLSPPPRTLPDP